MSEKLFPFVIPWDDSSENITNISGWIEKPAGKNGFITVKEGKFYTGDGKRIRFFGTNLTFGACFPEKDVAEKVAKRMARFGINIVRFHHMDSRYAPNGILDPTYKDKLHLDPGQLDKLDYFIYQLKKNGIYVDLNLKVSRKLTDAEGFPDWEKLPVMDKGVDIFEHRMIGYQKIYARDLLTHLNPYTGTRYVDEPAVAIIEINNENSLFLSWWRGWRTRNDKLPEHYTKELNLLWNLFLKRKYGSTSFMNLPGKQDLKEDLLEGKEWSLHTFRKAKAEIHRDTEEPYGEALKIIIDNPGLEGLDVQVSSEVNLKGKIPYTLSFWAKADKPRGLVFYIREPRFKEPTEFIYFVSVFKIFKLSSDWKRCEFSFELPENLDGAELVFTPSTRARGNIWISSISLRPGGSYGLKDGESIEKGNISLLDRNSFSRRSPQLQRDFLEFLWTLEEKYYTEMYRYIKENLKAKPLVAGTQLRYSIFPIQAKLDFIDAHAYWQHPRFPVKPWDPENWIVPNLSMVNSKGGTLRALASMRVNGYPYTVSEYNHPAPNTYSSEGFLLLAAYAAFQDWDGVFSFAYCNRVNGWKMRYIPNFFNVSAHPTKLVTLPASAAMFLRGDVEPGKVTVKGVFDKESILEVLRTRGPAGLSIYALGAPLATILKHKVALRYGEEKQDCVVTDVHDKDKVIISDTNQLVWDLSIPDAGYVTVNTRKSKMLVGFIRKRTFNLGEVKISPGETMQDWACITLTVMEGEDFSSSNRILVTATGYVENTNMGWNEEKNSVGTRWGEPPSLVEGIPAKITLPVPAERVKVYALDEKGFRKTEVPVEEDKGKATFMIGPQYKTLWYEIETK